MDAPLKSQPTGAPLALSTHQKSTVSTPQRVHSCARGFTAAARTRVVHGLRGGEIVADAFVVQLRQALHPQA